MNLHPALSSLRTRTLVAFGIMLVILAVILQLLAESIVARSYGVVEQRTVELQVDQAVSALESNIGALSRTNQDYATWDETYAFAQRRDPTYVAVHLSDETFVTLNISYLGVIDPAGQVVYARFFDLGQERDGAAPAELRSFDGRSAALLQHRDQGGSLAGVAVFGEQGMLISARPILTSDGAGPPAGTLVMGRVIDARELAQLAETTRLPVAISRMDAPDLAPALRQAAQGLLEGEHVVGVALDDVRISGATHIPDLLGGPGLLLHLELPREIFQLGQQVRREYTLVLIGACVLFGALVLMMLERLVLSRTLTLNRQLAAIDVRRPEQGVSFHGDDEIGQLGETVNRLLQRLGESQRAQAASELRYRQLVDLSPDAVIVHDGRAIQFRNPAATWILGVEQPGPAGAAVPTWLEQVRPRESGPPVVVEQSIVTPGGAVIEAELVALPFPDDGRPMVQAIVRNITERKQLERTLRQAKEAADTASRAKSQFVATVSHELRTPLTAILGYAELLQLTLDSSGRSELMEGLGRIRTAGTHLLGIVNSVLDLSQIEAGQMRVTLAPVELSSLLETIVVTIAPLAQQNGNQLIVARDDTLETLETDPLHLRQILVNLLGNACKFTHDGTVRLSVVRSSAPDGEGGAWVQFLVEDTGIGISPEHLELLFRDFVQVDASSTRRYGGTGIGLSLSRRLARLLGGDITVRSELERGSLFCLQIPITTPYEPIRARPTPAETPRPLPAAPARGAAEGAAPTTWLTLAIVDDLAAGERIAQALAPLPMHCELTTGAEEGVALAGTLLPDLIVLDARLRPPEQGALLASLEAVTDRGPIPILVLAAHDSPAAADADEERDPAGPAEQWALLQQARALLAERDGRRPLIRWSAARAPALTEER